ncbi:ATP-dependent nuclease [Pedobacter agri]|uniref:ATP-dependent nuclease n=1 Tax=Pedobacter agri TaxID=454586 RepID=UPI0029300D4A|nr:AAA family ATPase [Pedobacter agri]
MKIKRITIQNYKSISSLTIQCCRTLNALIGENSVGKSNIFEAVTWLLGPVYPSFSNIQPQDHYLGDLNNLIMVRLEFDDDNYLEMTEHWEDKRGNSKSGLNLSGGYINDEARQKYCSAYIGVDRNIMDYLPSNRWSLMGRILQDINNLFKKDEFVDENTGEVVVKSELFQSELERIRDEVLFSVKDKAGNEVMKQFVSILQNETAKQLNRKPEDLSIDLNLYDPWNFFRTLQVIVRDSCTHLSFQASKLGMGVQASISIAILKAYSQLKLNNSTPIFIDEPELFLHPQAQRNFYRLLIQLAENDTQIFYTTHSPNFLTVGRFNEVFVARRNSDKGTYVNSAHPKRFADDLEIRTGIQSTAENILLYHKNAFEETGDTQKANEGFFAKKILLVEGQSESLLIPYFFDLIGYDYLTDCLTIVRCGSKGEIDRFYRLYTELGIPCYVLFDGDGQHAGTADEKETVKKNRALLALFNVEKDFPEQMANEGYFAFSHTMNENLGFKTSKKGLALFIEVKNKISTENSVPNWVSEMKVKIEKIAAPEKSVLIRKQ